MNKKKRNLRLLIRECRNICCLGVFLTSPVQFVLRMVNKHPSSPSTGANNILRPLTPARDASARERGRPRRERGTHVEYRYARVLSILPLCEEAKRGFVKMLLIGYKPSHVWYLYLKGYFNTPNYR